MTTDIAALISKNFIARPDVKAIQASDGQWRPHANFPQGSSGPRHLLPWTRTDLDKHLAGEVSLGHYMLNENNQCKLFAFDIDVQKNILPPKPNPFQGSWMDLEGQVHMIDALDEWRNRASPARGYLKMSLMWAAVLFARIITDELQLPVAAAYSGHKGVHVYAFTGLISAADAREGAQIVLDTIGELEPTRGDNFYRTIDQDFTNPLRNLTVEVFPKQATKSADGFGNLMRLPLGKNLKAPKDPAFFLDLRSTLDDFAPLPPEAALTIGNPWRQQ